MQDLTISYRLCAVQGSVAHQPLLSSPPCCRVHPFTSPELSLGSALTRTLRWVCPLLWGLMTCPPLPLLWAGIAHTQQGSMERK